jgi:K+-transporting ATPase ATPase C chain
MGILYPLAVTGLVQVLFPGRANGSIIVRHGQPVGSELVGQPVDDPKYFWGRLSATHPAPYTTFNAERLTGSSGSNYGPLARARGMSETAVRQVVAQYTEGHTLELLGEPRVNVLAVNLALEQR